MSIFIYAEPKKQHQLDAAQAVADGLDVHGVECHVETSWLGLQDEKTIICWGNQCPVTDRECLFLESGYINGTSGEYTKDRIRFISVSWNALHGHADTVADRSSDRWEKLGIDLEPWRLSGEYALLLGQHQNDAVSPSAAQWQTIKRDTYAHWGSVKDRIHPLYGNTLPLSDDLAKARIAITWNSTAAVEAVIAGIPTVTYNAGSIAWPVTSHSVLEDAVTPDRGQWAYNLAYRQWTVKEFESGEAWEHIGR